MCRQVVSIHCVDHCGCNVIDTQHAYFVISQVASRILGKDHHTDGLRFRTGS